MEFLRIATSPVDMAAVLAGHVERLPGATAPPAA
jgi:hypothetical protein